MKVFISTLLTISFFIAADLYAQPKFKLVPVSEVETSKTNLMLIMKMAIG